MTTKQLKYQILWKEYQINEFEYLEVIQRLLDGISSCQEFQIVSIKLMTRAKLMSFDVSHSRSKVKLEAMKKFVPQKFVIIFFTGSFSRSPPESAYYISSETVYYSLLPVTLPKIFNKINIFPQFSLKSIEVILGLSSKLKNYQIDQLVMELWNRGTDGRTDVAKWLQYGFLHSVEKRWKGGDERVENLWKIE